MTDSVNPKISPICKKGNLTDLPSVSLMNSGKWYKFAVNKSGLYAISYDRLRALGFSKPEQIRVYGHSGIASEQNADPRYWELPSIKLEHSSNKIIFFVQGPNPLQYDTRTKLFRPAFNAYSDYAYYFLAEDCTDTQTNTVLKQTTTTLIPNTQRNTFTWVSKHEQNLYSLINSGKNWFGESFSPGSMLSLQFDEMPEAPKQVQFEAVLLGRSNPASTFTLSNTAYNSQLVIREIAYRDEADYAIADTLRGSFTWTGTTSVPFQISYASSRSYAKGWLDYFIVNAPLPLTYKGTPMYVAYPRNSAEIAQFSVANGTGLLVWDVTQPELTTQLPTTLTADKLSFVQDLDADKHFVIFDPQASIPEPIFSGRTLGMLTNQNLLATPASQMLIVCHPDYLAQATELANWHIAHDGLSVQIVTTVQIFNEFGSGVESPTAIRDYVRLIYNRSKNKVPGGLSYLLLLGDGNYNNRYDPESVTNFVPTYQSDNSLYTTLSFVSDDYYGLLDEEEGGATGFLDIGIGRLPARSTLEAQNMVDKIKRYYAEASMGTWRRQIAFVADDGDGGDGSYFMRQSEEMANSLLAKNPQFAVKKIYLDAYPQIATAIATESPQTNSEIDKAVSQGSLLINYVGHGSENGWTDEKILTNSQIESYTNSNKLAVFMTATCEFSRFDNPMHLSSGERLLQNPKGGAAALFTTTRLVYAYPNEVLNREFFNYAFLKQRPQDQLPMRLGDILRSAKIAVGTDNNKRNFTLLGDPAMPLSIPKYTVQLDQINQQNLGTQNIQIRALETVSANGSVRNGAGEIQNNFTGTVDITVYDRFLAKQTLGNDAPAFNYLETENNLYRTTVQVKNGLFNFNFIVPKDIRYETGPARMSFYAQDATTDAWGGYNKLLIGSTSDTNTTDTQGPEISIHFYDANSRNGGYTGTAPILYVILADPSGINTLGTAIGHDLKITIDNDPAQTYIVNAYYVADGEDFSSGKLIYQLPQLTNGTHSISLKAWDNRNNSSTADATFIVSDASAFTIFQLSNYPNPVHESTTFEFTHNRPNEAFTSTLSVYNTSGQIVAQYTQQTHDQGNTHHTFTWNARTLNGQRLAAGVYPYKIQVHTSTNEQATFSGKLTIAP